MICEGDDTPGLLVQGMSLTWVNAAPREVCVVRLSASCWPWVWKWLWEGKDCAPAVEGVPWALFAAGVLPPLWIQRSPVKGQETAF